MKNGKINYFTEVAIYSKKIKCPFMHFHGMNLHVLLLSQWIQLSTCILYKLGSIKAGAMYLIHLYILRRKRLTHNRQPCAKTMNLTLSSESVLDWLLSKYGNHKPSLQLKEFLRTKKKKVGKGKKVGEKMGRGVAVKLKTLASISPTLFKTIICLSFLEAHLGKGVVIDFPKATMSH